MNNISITFSETYSLKTTLKIINSSKNSFEKIQNTENKLSIHFNTKEKSYLLIGVEIGKYLSNEVDLSIDCNSMKKNEITQLYEGILIGNWKYEGHKSNKKEIKNLNLHILTNFDMKDDFAKIKSLIDSMSFTRSLVERPPNLLTPSILADISKNIPGLKCTVKEMKSGGIWEVGKASSEPSLLIVCEWNGNKDSRDPIALVGKGVTFDSGGLSLKPPKSMEDMKCDMAGAATVLGIMKYASEQNLEHNLIGIIPCVENVVSGNALKPGDVITSLSGKTIEVLNTDAEGRLILADALHIAQTEYKAKTIIDFATLTGAIVVALGEVYGGLFSNNNELSNQLIKSGDNIIEPLCKLPLHKKYDELMDTEIADMCNIQKPGSGAGSITAAQFLQRFINDDVKWAHIDIAGVARTARNSILGVKKSTGFGVRLIADLLDSIQKI